MRYAWIGLAAALLFGGACARDRDEAEEEEGTERVEEVVEQPDEGYELDLAFDPTVAPPLPEFVTLNTTVHDLEIHAILVVEHEVDSHRITRKEAPERLAAIIGAWVPQMQRLQAVYARAVAEKEAIAAREMEEAQLIHEWQVGNAEIEDRAARAAREAQLKQIRLISESTYRALMNEGRSPGCRYRAREVKTY